MYYDVSDDEVLKSEQIDVSREEGYWKLARLLSSAHLDEIRIVGETRGSVNIARTLVVAGQFRRRPSPRQVHLRTKRDEAYPRRSPYIFIDPVPDPAAFD